ncbi:MAG: hypothetical protein ACR2GN_05565 [Bacteroidia bacterium]
MISNNLTHIQEFEAETIYMIREVTAQFERPVLMFSGGKDSTVMTQRAIEALHPARIPFPLLHIVRDGVILAYSPYLVKKGEKPEKMHIRFRTVGDMTYTGAGISSSKNFEEIITEIAVSRITERGTRTDDKRS